MGSVANKGTSSITGVPDKMPTMEEVLKAAKALKGKALEKAISDLEWDADWYREDKRQKKKFVEDVVRYNYFRDPVEAGSNLSDQLDSNDKILAAVYGLSRYGNEISERFGYYNTDLLFKRSRK